MERERTCAAGLHLYPAETFPVPAGTPCHCGTQTWAGAPRREMRPKVGARVRVLGADRTIIEKLRGEEVYRVDAPVAGRALFEPAELEML